MTAYTAIADSEIDPESPGTTTLFTKLRDNPIAISEGTSPAPSIQTAALISGEQMTTTNVLAKTAAASAGAVGTYVFAVSSTTSDVSFGSTRAGSALFPASAAKSGDGASWNLATGSALSGTWRCMGNYDYVASATFGATLWLRIS